MIKRDVTPRFTARVAYKRLKIGGAPELSFCASDALKDAAVL